jgi:hypothetical protein
MDDEDEFDKMFYDLTISQCPWCGKSHKGDNCPTEDEDEDWSKDS